MHLRKNNAELSVMEAVDNLSNMAELDETLSAIKETDVAMSQELAASRLHARSWQDPEYYAYNRERIRETFQVILKYMKDLCEKNKARLQEAETQRGVQAIMGLALEAVQKIDQFTKIFQGEKGDLSATELKEYKELKHFYETRVVQRFQTVAEEGKMWQADWGSGISNAHGDVQGLESVRSDKEYELFFIAKENGKPFFSKSLLRHIQLVGEFDVLLGDSSQDNLFLHIQTHQDKEVQSAAQEILHLASPYIDDYYKEAMKFKQIGFVAAINKALMALMLAANVRNLMQTAIGKSSLRYYADFHYYLRTALKTQEYQRYLSHSSDSENRFFGSLMRLTHMLCSCFFLRESSKKGMISLIHLLIEKGGRGAKEQSQTASPLALWNRLLDQDDNIRFLLTHYPNGPLKKILKKINEEALLEGFDPIGHGNLPSLMYTLESDDIHVACLRLPSPTEQQRINKATVAEEFYGFLRSLEKNQRHLLINLQDRTSSLEYTRCDVLEKISQDTEFSNRLIVVTLPKNGDFYLQSGCYFEVNDAVEFMEQLKHQVASGEACGFYFPADVDRNELLKFSEAVISTIHTVFFAGKKLLLHKNRLDFIEIFYLMCTLKLIEFLKPDTISLTCKDGVDTGTIASTELFAFCRMMNGASHWSELERDFLLWMIYSPSLAMRERAIDGERFSRMVSSLSLIAAEIEAHRDTVVAAFSKLYKLSLGSIKTQILGDQIAIDRGG